MYKANGWTIFNFGLSNGMVTDFKNKIETPICESIKENETIGHIRMLYKMETKNDAGGCLIDLALYDRDKKLILKTYSFD